MAHQREKGHKNTIAIIEKKLVPATIFHELENKGFYFKDHSLDQIKKWKTTATERERSHQTPAPHKDLESSISTSHDAVISKAESLRGKGESEGLSLEPRERLIANEGLRDPLSHSETYIVNPYDDDDDHDQGTTAATPNSFNSITSGATSQGSSFLASHTTGSPKIAGVAHPHSKSYQPKVRKIYEERAKHLLKCLEGHGNLITWNDYGRISVGGNLLDTTWSEVLPALFSKNAPIHKDTNKVLEVICHLKCEDIISNPALCQNQKFSWFYLDY